MVRIIFKPIKIFLYEFMNELISKFSLKFIFLNDVLAFKNNVSDKCILNFSLVLTLCWELQRCEINSIIKF